MAHLLLYGGTFDPIHLGHLITCRAAREILHADGILLLPARLSPHKQGDPPGALAQQRLDMIHRAIGTEPEFSVDAREFSRPGPSYTIDTLRELKRDRPNDCFTLLIGADQLAQLHTWHNITSLFDETPIALLRRGNDELLREGLDALQKNLGTTTAARLQLLSTPHIDISATAIRRRVRENLPISFLVPPAVADYIRQNKLYSGSTQEISPR